MNAVISTLDRASRLLPGAPLESLGEHTLSLHHDLADLRDEWLAFEEIAAGTVFQTYEWLAAYQEFIGARRGEIPCIAVVRGRAGKIACILPLAVRRAGLLRELAWLGTELCDYNAPLTAPGFFAGASSRGFTRLWHNVLARLRADPRTSFTIVRLAKMPEYIDGQPNPMVSALPISLNPSGSYATKMSGAWESFYAAKRSPSTRRRDRGKQAKLAECGPIVFRSPQEGRSIAAALDALIRQKSQFFAGRGIANIFARAGYRQFYHAIAADSRFNRIAHVGTLEVDGEVAAVNLGLRFRDRYYYVLASYTDSPLSRFSPGTLHLHNLMRAAMGAGTPWFDFTIGDEPYKRDWCDEVQPLYDHIASASVHGAFVVMLLKWAQQTKRTIKQTPLLWTLFGKLRAIGAARRRHPEALAQRAPIGSTPSGAR